MLVNFPLIISGLATANALALPKADLTPRKAGDLAVDQLLQIAPGSKTCNGGDHGDECRTAEQAAPFLIIGFQKYGIYNANEMAILTSLIAYESNDFKYHIHHYPSEVAGQGTRAMMQSDHILAYARSIKDLEGKVNAITPAGSTAESLSDKQKNDVLALVLPDEYSWEAAMWYYTTKDKCKDARVAAQNRLPIAFELYSKCVGYPFDQKRVEKYDLALKAFGLKE